MKRILTILLLVIATLVAADARRAPGDKIGVHFDSLVYDFGTVSADSTPVHHDFEYTVTGETAVAVLSAQANCGCTKPKYERRPVAPGKTATISVSFVPTGQRGEIDKEIRVRLSAGKGKNETVTLRLRGVVIPK